MTKHSTNKCCFVSSYLKPWQNGFIAKSKCIDMNNIKKKKIFIQMAPLLPVPVCVGGLKFLLSLLLSAD